MDIEDSFGIVIRRLRKDRSLSQDKLSAISGLDRKFISNIEAGKQQPSLVTITALAKALHCSASMIMFECEFIHNIHNKVIFKEDIERNDKFWSEYDEVYMAVEDFGAGSETILIADDEAAVLYAISEYLRIHGYTVITAEDGRDAVEKYKQHGDHIHLVVMDVVMPRLDGVSSYREIKKINPDVLICLMSGYSRGLLRNHDNFLFLQKPFAPEELLKMIRNALDGEQAAL